MNYVKAFTTTACVFAGLLVSTAHAITINRQSRPVDPGGG
jgi:hypothetical protein